MTLHVRGRGCALAGCVVPEHTIETIYHAMTANSFRHDTARVSLILATDFKTIIDYKVKAQENVANTTTDARNSIKKR